MFFTVVKTLRLLLDLSVNFTDCSQNRRSCLKTVEIPSFTPAIGGGERYYQLIWTTTKSTTAYKNTSQEILGHVLK
ncbi:MAG: hypothetical protein LBR79_05940 [Oscillospiraceae bacterium]|nr:hypothetical protein [Oscillospiraceae bacterium]